MTSKNETYRKKLILLLQKQNKEHQFFPCIEDLAAHGLVLSRFTDSESHPSRQDITQHLLSWFFYIGIPQEDCEQWIMHYCLDMLSELSSSTHSQIKHSVKSTIKYIYGSKIALDCGGKNNPFKAACRNECPLYSEMAKRYEERTAIEKLKTSGIVEKYVPPEKKEPNPTVKEIYKDKYEASLTFIKECMRQGLKRNEISALLQQQGYLSRTGKLFSSGVFNREWKQLITEQPELYHQYLETLKANKAKNREDTNNEQYIDQWKEAMELAFQQYNEGMKIYAIVELLNSKGYKTQIGKPWLSPSLRSDLKQWHSKQ